MFLLTKENNKQLTKPEDFDNWNPYDKVMWLFQQCNWVHGSVIKYYIINTLNLEHALSNLKRTHGCKFKNKVVKKAYTETGIIHKQANYTRAYHLVADDTKLPVEIHILGEKWEQVKD